jgi:dephospho-CoA kinase
MTVGIIGGRGTGKTVFVSLLANTAIKYSVETKEHFRYLTSPEFTPIIQDIIASLKLRKWPPDHLKNSLIGHKFWFAYSKKLNRILNTLYDNLEKLSEAIKKLETPRKELYRHTLALVYGEL